MSDPQDFKAVKWRLVDAMEGNRVVSFYLYGTPVQFSGYVTGVGHSTFSFVDSGRVKAGEFRLSAVAGVTWMVEASSKLEG